MKINEIHLKTVDSTNTYAKQHAAEFDPLQMTCISADEQTAGRGRFHRTWISPPGVNLYATFYFQLPAQLHTPSLAQLLALSFTSVLNQEGLSPRIKWPNDVQLEGKKVSGILCELAFGKETVDVFLGIGVNVNMEEADLAQVGQPATSLKVFTNKSWDRAALLHQIQREFIKDLALFKSKGFAPFQNRFFDQMAHKGESVRIYDGKNTWIGICEKISENGELVLRLEDGSLHLLRAGDLNNH